jgi:hypothetical protein
MSAQVTQRSTAALGGAPERIIELTTTEMYALSLEDQKTIQLAGARKRFEELANRIPVIERLVAEQGITAIRSLNDLAPLLMPHSALKSYPLSYLEKSRFDRMTAWLNGFTTCDLSGLDASGIDSIDGWIDLLDSRSELRIAHSSGTTGKLSIIPRSAAEWDRFVVGWRRMFDRFRDERPRMGVPLEAAPTIFVQYRKGAMAQHRILDVLQKHLYGGDPSMIVTTNPSRFSADAASVGGRLRAAQSKGELGRIQISPKLLQRRDAFLNEQQRSAHYLDEFLADVSARFRGKTVSLMGHIPMLHNLALEGIKRGCEGMFAADSFIMAGGGLKGVNLPEGWRDTVDRFFGGAPLSLGYGMTELLCTTRACPYGNYHMVPCNIPFVLDPQTGEPSPRTGTVTGRFGAFDLNPVTYWGGFLTGDEVTVSWGDDAPCPCGRIGSYVHPEVRRLSEREGGDDKITCAGAPEAHDKAIDFILQSIG